MGTITGSKQDTVVEERHYEGWKPKEIDAEGVRIATRFAEKQLGRTFIEPPKGLKNTVWVLDGTTLHVLDVRTKALKKSTTAFINARPRSGRLEKLYQAASEYCSERGEELDIEIGFLSILLIKPGYARIMHITNPMQELEI